MDNRINYIDEVSGKQPTEKQLEALLLLNPFVKKTTYAEAAKTLGISQAAVQQRMCCLKKRCPSIYKKFWVMKLAIVGSRTFSDYDLFLDFAQKYFRYEIDTIISGGAKGADSLAKRFAKYWRFEYLEFLPNWNELGKVAGFKRNQQIVDECDMVLAFWDGKSRGTQDTINKAKIAKKPTFIVYF